MFRVDEEMQGTKPQDFAKLRDELPERLSLVRMAAVNGDSIVSVELGLGAKVDLVEPGPAARGVLASVKEICGPHRIRRTWGLWASIAVVAALISSFLLFDALRGGATAVAALPAFLSGVTAIAALATVSISGLLAISANRRPGDFGDIILNVPRAERPTFGQRLFADGGVSAFWTVVGLVCGGAIGYLVNQLPGL
ncbi:hypothetical protein [Nocardiopsis sp. B62]|uniref:hypothetical protein n=1 Tax=Nocardiopsis sp. B62 TaxID=2824874 RepID=UPI001FFCD3D9|nr:hypothetical protein [Nocardiopsis sp. B62]